jgi:hypothetical protein
MMDGFSNGPSGYHDFHDQHYDEGYGGLYDDDRSSPMMQLVSKMGLAKAESMDLTNDPRFFSATVVDKRLKAFGSLSIVSGLMLGTSMGQCYKLKKDWDLSFRFPYIGYFQACGFVMQMTVTFMCLISLYVIAHQLFYTFRLMTSGPAGFECACVFYLNKYMVMWRHFSIKCLLNGLWLFILSSGFQLFGKFYVDAESTHHLKHEHLDMQMHALIGWATLFCFTALACLLCLIRSHHVAVFREEYSVVKTQMRPVESTVAHMQRRGGLNLDT